jgi:predicted RNase H-like HicB family nuclease
MDRTKYRIEIFWSDEDEGYIANVPALRYCSAFGESYEEALREVLVAMELHLDTLRELDRPIPEPESRKLADRFFENWAETLEDTFRKQASSQEATEAYTALLNSLLEEHRSAREHPQRRASN